MNSGIASPVVNKGLPQVPQKLRVARRPLDARTEYSRGEPLMSTEPFGTTTPEANGAPLDCWQSRQWQFSMANGSLEHA